MVIDERPRIHGGVLSGRRREKSMGTPGNRMNAAGLKVPEEERESRRRSRARSVHVLEMAGTYGYPPHCAKCNSQPSDDFLRPLSSALSPTTLSMHSFLLFGHHSAV